MAQVIVDGKTRKAVAYYKDDASLEYSKLDHDKYFLLTVGEEIDGSNYYEKIYEEVG